MSDETYFSASTLKTALVDTIDRFYRMIYFISCGVSEFSTVAGLSTVHAERNTTTGQGGRPLPHPGECIRIVTSTSGRGGGEGGQ
jgi:hypothetical protein